MSTTTPSYPDVTCVRRAFAVGLIAILILISLALIAYTILDMFSSVTRDAHQADRIPVVNNLIIPVPMPPTADIQSGPSEKSIPTYARAGEPSVVPVPVPTQPS